MTLDQPNIIIVDHANDQLRKADFTPFLDANVENLKIGYLTLADNKMIVYNRKEIIKATPTDLLQALHRISR